MVRSVGARNNHTGAVGVRFGDHLAGGVAHAAKTHLGQVVEVVLVEHHDIRACGLQSPCVVFNAVGKHRVEQCDLMPHLPQECSDLDRGERGIGLAAFPLFPVVTQEIRVTDLNL